MKNTKPTLFFLVAFFILNFSKAQEKFGLDIQKKNQTDVSDFVPLNQDTKRTFQNSSKENQENEEELSRRLFPITFSFDGSWSPYSPIGLATSIDSIILESGSINITSNTICNNLVVNPGASVTIDAGVTLTSDVIDLKSTSQLYSSLILNGTAIGVVNYHRFTSQIGTNDLISSPVSTQLFESFALLNDSNLAASGFIRAFAPYNTTTGAYENYNTQTNALTLIESGMGYRAATTDGSPLVFTGLVRTDDVLDIPISDAAAGDGWNLIGNPYPSYIDFNSFFTLNKMQLDNESTQAIYGYDGDASDGWTVWNQATIDSPAQTELLAPGQAFFVKAKSGGGLIDFTTAMRCAGSSDDFIAGRRTDSPHFGHLKIGLTSSNSNSSTDIYFNTNASGDFDSGYDAGIFGEPSSFSIYSQLINNGTTIPLAIQSLNPETMFNIIVPLGVNASQGQEITFSILENDMLDDIKVYLADTYNNTVTLLTDSDYILTPTINLSGVGRFYLSFSSDTLNVTESSLETLDIFTNDNENTIVISGQLQNGSEVELFDTNGRVVLSNSLKTNSMVHTIDVSMLSAGIYIIELNNNLNERRVQKLVIK
ncbi:T9SS type A sorting domain-containing protein [Psychroserpens sp. AS72]|uniref:T9SS type A sorting domain-containing protein n=1 Tax=Psychroserpens sp. AS72 TaxID=3135775 RepID=UPI003178FE5B